MLLSSSGIKDLCVFLQQHPMCPIIQPTHFSLIQKEKKKKFLKTTYSIKFTVQVYKSTWGFDLLTFTCCFLILSYLMFKIHPHNTEILLLPFTVSAFCGGCLWVPSWSCLTCDCLSAVCYECLIWERGRWVWVFARGCCCRLDCRTGVVGSTGVVVSFAQIPFCRSWR